MKRFWYCLVVLLIVSCTKTEEVRIPYRQVNLRLYLNDKDRELLNPNNSKIYTSKSLYGDKLGFGGVIVYYSPFGSHVAYDLACPYEASANSLIEVENQGDPYAICPHCESKYDLTNGISMEGISTYRLQQYKVYYQSASELVVQH